MFGTQQRSGRTRFTYARRKCAENSNSKRWISDNEVVRNQTRTRPFVHTFASSLSFFALPFLSVVLAKTFETNTAHADDTLTQASAPVAPDDARLFDPISDATRNARGMYFNSPLTRMRGAEGIIRTVRAAGLSAAVIDVKDDRGRVLFDTQVPELLRSKRNFLPNFADMIAEVKAAGIHTIARVVCFNDGTLSTSHPELAVMDRREGRARQHRPWISWGTGTSWVDPSNPRVQRIIHDLVIEIAALGFDEIQLDYIRFPVDAGVRFARFPALDPHRRRSEIIVDLLRSIDRDMQLPLGVDVFGIQALHAGDRAGLGQNLEEWTPYVEVFSPMLYANSFKSWRASPGQERGASFVYTAMARVRSRLGPEVVIRPYIQAFSKGADAYGGEFVRGQIRAARDGGAHGFLFWHPGSTYGMVTGAITGSGRRVAEFVYDGRMPVVAEPASGSATAKNAAPRGRRRNTRQ